MYKIIKIGADEYKLEFSIEASLYNDCIEKITNLMYSIDSGQTKRDVRQLLSGVSDIPNTAVTCFYAGLLEHHGIEGDGKVLNLLTAKRLAAKLIKDETSDVSNWYDLLTTCLEQMGEDGFFDLIGMSDMLNVEPKKKEPKKPQDHKKKQTKVSEE